MKAINLLTLSLLATIVHCEFKPEDIAPCSVHPIAQIYCVGEEITDEVIKKIGSKLDTEVVNVFSIHSTAITKLDKNTFTTGIFENIFIEDNQHLTSISPEAFHKTSNLYSLTIRNNSKLSDPNVFAMARFLEPSDHVSFIRNAIKEVPANAFQTANVNNPLKHIYLGYNKITQIDSHAFNHLPSLIELYVDHNPLATIAANGLAFAPSTSGHITVYLNDNQLSSKSFTNTSIISPATGALTIDLENNLFTDLPESIFKHFAQKRINQLFVYNNRFNCDCSMKWIIDPVQETNIKGLYCFNAKKEIFSVTEKELGCSQL